ncbi:hypothetical protein PoB_006743700 [Plakobranchus ocellatus]|uniref:Uncharacterized protein n=1 Tax=Plakobranchus ocellatus TaxID=259542 RepID=A0AAV4D9S8_9GAST|nr:hypothetical protein PoB_006743700 [Plakobranchus ocellatus]
MDTVLRARRTLNVRRPWRFPTVTSGFANCTTIVAKLKEKTSVREKVNLSLLLITFSILNCDQPAKADAFNSAGDAPSSLADINDSTTCLIGK